MLWVRTIVVWAKFEYKCGYNSNHKLMQHMHSVSANHSLNHCTTFLFLKAAKTDAKVSYTS